MVRPIRSRGVRGGAIPISEFKARCLRLVAEVGETGRELIITRNGKPVAKVVPLARPPHTTRGIWKDAVRVRGDIVHGDRSEELEAAREG